MQKLEFRNFVLITITMRPVLQMMMHSDTLSEPDRQTIIDTIEALILEADKYFNSDSARLQELADEILPLSTSINYDRGIAYGEYYTGRVLYRHSEFEKALVYHTTALQSFEKIGDNQGVLSSLRQVGVTYQMLCHYDKALECYNRELSIQQQADNKTGIAATLANIATVYLLIGQQDIALESYLRALSVIETLGDDHALLIAVLGNIANLYMSLDEYEEALTYQKRVLAICQKRNDNSGEALTLVNIGWNYLQSKLYEKSLEYSFLALNIFEDVGDRRQKATALQHIGQAYLQMKQYMKSLSYFEDSYTILYEVGDRRGCADSLRSMGDLFVAMESHTEAKKYYRDSLDIVKQIGLRQTEYELCELIAHVEEQTDNTREALYYYHEYMRLKEEVLNQHRLQTISEMQIRFNVEQSQKEKEIYRLKNVELAGALEKVESLNRHLAEVSNEKSELLGVVAHDLRSPLSGIQMVCSLLKDHHERMPVQELAHQLEEVVLTTGRMLGIVNNLLDVQAIEAGSVYGRPYPVAVITVVRSVIKRYRDAVLTKNLTLYLTCSDDRLKVLGTEESLFQIVDNLVGNAVKFSPLGKNIAVLVEQSGGCVILKVQNEGIGIQLADRERLFEKFGRLSARPTGGESSTGLGLWIVHKTTEALQGKVWCESEPGKGATFIVELPAAL